MRRGDHPRGVLESISLTEEGRSARRLVAAGRLSTGFEWPAGIGRDSDLVAALPVGDP